MADFFNIFTRDGVISNKAYANIDGLWGPYESTNEAVQTITSRQRAIGKKFGVKVYNTDDTSDPNREVVDIKEYQWTGTGNNDYKELSSVETLQYKYGNNTTPTTSAELGEALTKHKIVTVDGYIASLRLDPQASLYKIDYIDDTGTLHQIRHSTSNNVEFYDTDYGFKPQPNSQAASLYVLTRGSSDDIYSWQSPPKETGITASQNGVEFRKQGASIADLTIGTSSSGNNTYLTFNDGSNSFDVLIPSGADTFTFNPAASGGTTYEELAAAVAANKIITIGRYIVGVYVDNGTYKLSYVDRDGSLKVYSVSTYNTVTNRELTTIDLLENSPYFNFNPEATPIATEIASLNDAIQAHKIIKVNGFVASVLTNSVEHTTTITYTDSVTDDSKGGMVYKWVFDADTQQIVGTTKTLINDTQLSTAIRYADNVSVEVTNGEFIFKKPDGTSLFKITKGTSGGNTYLNFVKLGASNEEISAAIPVLQYDSSTNMLQYNNGDGPVNIMKLSNLQIKYVDSTVPSTGTWALGDLILIGPDAQDNTYTLHVYNNGSWLPIGKINEVSTSAVGITYDNEQSNLEGENVQEAIDEIASKFEFGNKGITEGYKYANNTTYTPVADGRYCLSPYIPCSNGDTVEFYGGYEGTAIGMPLFNSSKAGMYNYAYNAEPKTQVIDRANTAYTRLSFLKENIGAYVKVNGVKVFEWSGRVYEQYNLTEISDKIGNTTNLKTEVKDSLTNAVNEVNAKASPVYDKLYYKKYLMPPFARGEWRNIGEVGTTFVPTTYESGDSYQIYRRTKIKVEEGDKIYIDNLYVSFQSNNPYRAWVFVDEDNTILSRATAVSYTNLVLTAPQGAKMLYVQSDFTHTPIVNIWKNIIAQDKDDTDDGWEALAYKAHRARTGYILTQNIGEKFNFSNSVNGAPGIWYKVCPKDKIRLSTQVLSGNNYSYQILGRGKLIIAAGEVPSDRMLADYEFEVPLGGEALVIASTPNSYIVKINRENETNPNIDFISKESVLMSLSENQNISTNGLQNKRLTLAWCSDTHDDGDNYRRFIEYVNGHQGIIDAVLHTGDMNGVSDTDNGFSHTVLKYRSAQPFLPIMGNHDSHGATVITQNREVLASGSQEWQANKYVVPFMDNKCVRGESNCYFYRDFDAYKIRIICLLDYDISRRVSIPNWETTTNGTEIENAVDWQDGVEYAVGTVVNYKGLYLKAKVASTLSNVGDYYAQNSTNVPYSYYKQTGRYLQQEQVDFFIDALTDRDKDTPKLTTDWGIIIATHIPFDGFVSGNKLDDNWQDKRGTELKAYYSQNGYILGDIVKAFLDKAALNKTYEAIQPTQTPLGTVTKINNQTDCPNVVVNVDFGELNTNAHIICTMAGHTHQQGCYRASTVGNHKVVNLVSETGCYAPELISIPDGFYEVYGVSDVIRGGNAARDCFNIISFDTTNKYIYLMRIGADTTDIMTKRDFTRISYADDGGSQSGS